MKEVWKDVKGFEDYYQVSNTGRVRSKDRQVKRGNGRGICFLKSKILKPQLNNKGYLRIEFKVDGTATRYFIHRLVAETFVPIKGGNDIVNHLDSNPLNNRADNLEWTTYKGNIHHAIKKGRFDKSFALTLDKFKADRESKQTPVIGTHIKTGKKVYFPTLHEAGRRFNGDVASICNCCQGKRMTAQGYRWEYAEKQEKRRGEA